MRQIVCLKDSPTYFFVADHFGDVGTEIAAGLVIDPHHLERGSDPAGTETRNDSVIPVAKLHNLIFGPKSSRWRDDCRQFAQ